MAKKKMSKTNDKLRTWQDRYEQARAAWDTAAMDHRETLYKGDDRTLEPLVPGDKGRNGRKRKTSHRRNIVFELIESQVSSAIPQPKVTPIHAEDEPLAEIIEHFLRNELDRLPFEAINDMAERTVPIQGGVGFFDEWDNSKRTQSTVGVNTVSVMHPKTFCPQPGVYTDIEDMDWFIILVPSTKTAVRRKYGVDIGDGRSDAETAAITSTDGETQTEDAVTVKIGFARNDRGGIDRYAWVDDIELEDMENYQARRQPYCKKCGHIKPLIGQTVLHTPAEPAPGNLLPDPASGFAGGMIPQDIEQQAAGRALALTLAEKALSPEPDTLADVPLAAATPSAEQPQPYDGGACPWCGANEWEDRESEYEQVLAPINARNVDIPGMHPGLDENGNAALVPTLIPFYSPDVYPVVLQKSVSVHGQLLGNSDVDIIADQQNTTNRIEQKIIDRLIKAGTRITLPDRADMRTDPEDGERWYIGDPAHKALIDVYQFSGNLQYEMAYLSQVYEESRQLLGITDSFQGRRDATATSGKAKEFSAAQAAGRLESKRVMKNAAYARLFELMFKFWLAYGDEPRPVSYKDAEGRTQYETFNRYDFLKQDRDGNYYWEDGFLFSCDSTTPLASNREALWQETRQNLQTGAFGDPTSTETLILFWSKMEELHYPGAAATKKYLEDRLKREQAEMAAQATTEQLPFVSGFIPPGSSTI